MPVVEYASPGSYVGKGELLKASKRETLLQINLLTVFEQVRPLEDYQVERSRVYPWQQESQAYAHGRGLVILFASLLCA